MRQGSHTCILVHHERVAYALPSFSRLVCDKLVTSGGSCLTELLLADEDSLKSVIGRLGLQSLRARRLIEISCLYLLDPPSIYDRRPSRHVMKGKRYPPTPISHLPGTGPYALDSYRIFCDSYNNPASEEWKKVMPTDKELIRFLVSVSPSYC